jgi:hypothetical protein
MADTDQPVLDEETGPPERTGGTAWVSLGVLAAAVPTGLWASSAVLERRGDGLVVGSESATLGLLAYLVLGAIVLPAALLAVRNGSRARRRGHRGAVVVVVLAGAVTVAVLLGLPVVMSRIIGWPMVVAMTAGTVGVGWLTQRWGWGNMGRSGPLGSG